MLKLWSLDIPDEIRQVLDARVQAIEQSSREALRILEQTFVRGARSELPAPQLAVFQSLEPSLHEVRQRYLSGAINFPQAIPYLGAMDFLENTARKIDLCAAEIRALSLEKYSGDYAL